MTFNSLGLFCFCFFYSPDGDRGCERTKSRAERAEAFPAEGKHVASGVWCQWENHGEPLIAFITFSQIKMSTSGKNSVPLCSLVIRGSIFPPFHTRRALWKHEDGPRQKELQLVCLFSSIFLSFRSSSCPVPSQVFSALPKLFNLLVFLYFFLTIGKFIFQTGLLAFFSAELPKSTKRHNIVWKFQILLVSFYIFKQLRCLLLYFCTSAQIL